MKQMIAEFADNSPKNVAKLWKFMNKLPGRQLKQSLIW